MKILKYYFLLVSQKKNYSFVSNNSFKKTLGQVSHEIVQTVVIQKGLYNGYYSYLFNIKSAISMLVITKIQNHIVNILSALFKIFIKIKAILNKFYSKI